MVVWVSFTFKLGHPKKPGYIITLLDELRILGTEGVLVPACKWGRPGGIRFSTDFT